MTMEPDVSEYNITICMTEKKVESNFNTLSDHLRMCGKQNTNKKLKPFLKQLSDYQP